MENQSFPFSIFQQKFGVSKLYWVGGPVTGWLDEGLNDIRLVVITLWLDEDIIHIDPNLPRKTQNFLP